MIIIVCVCVCVCADASYADPLGELPDRARTSRQQPPDEDDFLDADGLEDLLPE